MKKIAAKQPSEKIIGKETLPAPEAGIAKVAKTPAKSGRSVLKKAAKTSETKAVPAKTVEKAATKTTLLASQPVMAGPAPKAPSKTAPKAAPKKAAAAATVTKAVNVTAQAASTPEPVPVKKTAVKTVKKPVKTPPAETKAETKSEIKAAPKKSEKIVEPKKTKPAAKKAAVSAITATATPSPLPRRKAPEISRPLEIPSILLEGDAAPAVTATGPGEKYSLGATPPTQSFTGGELPESYGTKKLFLTARDPHWLYAHWDLTRDQQNELNNLSTDGHLVLRIFAGKIEGHPACEIHVHPESRHWFAHVERAGSSYSAELGYYSSLGKWIRVAVSSGTVTPPDAAAAVESEAEAEFATIPFEFPFEKLMQIVEEAVRDNIPLSRAIEELRRHGHPDLPRFSSTGFSSVAPSPSSSTGETRVWTPEQERALAKIIKIDETRRVWMGSLEITELIRRRLAHDASSPVAGFTSPAGYVPGGVSSASVPAGLAGAGIPSPGSSPSPVADKNKGFWFNVNAELIIYGATEPTARVTLGGHEIKLRADGTFSFRFALPDGKYDLPAVAVSADGTDGRAAELKFSRETEYLGEVGVTPPDPALKPPLPDNI